MLISKREQDLILLIRTLEFGEVYSSEILTEEPTEEVSIKPEEKILILRVRENPEIHRLTIHDRRVQYLEVKGEKSGIKYIRKFKF